MKKKDEQIKALVEIIETLCIELKKDNNISRRRMQAKKQRERMKEVLGRVETAPTDGEPGPRNLAEKARKGYQETLETAEEGGAEWLAMYDALHVPKASVTAAADTEYVPGIGQVEKRL